VSPRLIVTRASATLRPRNGNDGTNAARPHQKSSPARAVRRFADHRPQAFPLARRQNAGRLKSLMRRSPSRLMPVISVRLCSHRLSGVDRRRSQEMRNRWWIAGASLAAQFVGSGAINVFAFAVFLKPVAADLGIGRGVLSSALSISTSMTALGCLAFGALFDSRPLAFLRPDLPDFRSGSVRRLRALPASWAVPVRTGCARGPARRRRTRLRALLSCGSRPRAHVITENGRCRS